MVRILKTILRSAACIKAIIKGTFENGENGIWWAEGQINRQKFNTDVEKNIKEKIFDLVGSKVETKQCTLKLLFSSRFRW